MAEGMDREARREWSESSWSVGTGGGGGRGRRAAAADMAEGFSELGNDER